MRLIAARYELGAVIGRGAMAEVRGARDTRLDRPVAVKLMRPEVAHQPLVRDRFETEARLAARLIHPNVVAVFDSGEDGGIPFIVMERLPGETLHDRLARGALGEPEARQLALEILAALDTAHAAGVLHRDIKPANVLATSDGHWKVADFGIAKALEVDQGDATATGLVLGTPAYLAPERLYGAPATVASDIYAVGVLIYEALTGRRPYEAGAADAWPSVVTGTVPTPLDVARPGVDPALAAAVDRALAKDPGERFWSAAEMAAVIGSTGAGGSAGGEPWGAATALMAAAPATDVLPAGAAAAAGAVGAASAVGGVTQPIRRGAGGLVHRSDRHPAALPLLVAAAVAILVAVILAATTSGRSTHGGVPSRSPATTATTPAPTTTTSTSTTTTAPPAPAPGPGPGKHKDGGTGGHDG